MNITKFSKRLAPVGLAVALVIGSTAPASAAVWTGYKLTPSDPTPGAVNTYKADFTTATSGVKCLKVTVVDGSGNAPTGFAWSSGSASVLTTTGVTIGTIGAASVASNVVSFTNSGSGAIAGAGSFSISNVKNPTTAGSYFAKYDTFGNTDCATSPLDSTNVGYIVSNNTQVSVIVDPTLSFVVAGTNALCGGQSGTVTDNTTNGVNISMGHVTSSTVGNGAQTVTVNANAGGGAVVQVRGQAATGNLKLNGTGASFGDSGTTAPAAGAERFGWTSADAPTWHTLDNGTTNAASFSNAQLGTAKCVGYSASAAGSTAAGTYSGVVIYTAIPTY